MSHRILRSLLATSLLLPLAGAQAAEPWEQSQVLTPPVEAGYTSTSTISFGEAIAMNETWLAVFAPYGVCNTPGGTVTSTILMYRYDATAQRFVYAQQVCGAGRVKSMAIWNDWLVTGAPLDDDTPGDGTAHGRVRFYQLGGAPRRWSLAQVAVGAVDSLQGWSVAIDGGVAAAGEPGHDDRRGRVQTWRLDTQGTGWLSEGFIGAALPPFVPVAPGEVFGAAIALDVGGCRAPSCLKPHDTLILHSRSGLHSVERLANGWGSRALVKPARGTETAYSAVAINGSIAVAGAVVPSDDAGESPCPWIGPDYYTAMTRVLTRMPGSAHLKSTGFACMDELGVANLRSSSAIHAVAPEGREFVVGVPDYPTSYEGVVATWDLHGPGGTIQPTDAVVDLDYTERYYDPDVSGTQYNPTLSGDYFGASVAMREDRLVVGAPFYNWLSGQWSAGYVVVYRR